MQRPTRRLSAVLLALTLLLLPAAAHAEPAARSVDRWLDSVLDVLGDLVSGLWTIGAASETGSEPSLDDDGDTQVSPSGESDDSSDRLVVRREVAPHWEPNG